MEEYYVGLDCGTNSVGWAVTDEKYNLLRYKGKTLWGSRLFDEAKPAAERRAVRSSRRRTRRSADRIKLLNILFAPEINKCDPEFFLRLKKSFLLEEDKKLKKSSKNTLFFDEDFTDNDFHKRYPTIWHLRKAIIEAPKSEHFDIRLYYLAIHHIMRNRGHFLREGRIKGAGDFGLIFENFVAVAEGLGIEILSSARIGIDEIIRDKTLTITDRRKKLKTVMFELENITKQQDELAGLLAGSKITPVKIFEQVESEKTTENTMKLSLASDDLDEKLGDLEKELDQDQIALIVAAKSVYDYGFLSNLLSGEEFVSFAMVKNYETHKNELAELKGLLKPFAEDYNAFFKTKMTDSVCYNTYIGNAYTIADKKTGRRKSTRPCSQEDINKEVKKILEKNNIKTDLLEKAERFELLPKQRGQAKGTIPEQLHHNELEIIVTRLAREYPRFAEKDLSEPEQYDTLAKKILSIHSFRIPYYCGPLVSKNKSEFSWADDEIAELVRPWNFSRLVNLDARADKFIRNMTKKCTYLPTEDVLPKASFLNQKYLVLQELNNLKINGHRIDDVVIKQKIYERVFENAEITGNVTLRSLEKWLRNAGVISGDDELSGATESKFLPKLTTHQDFFRIFGPDYRKNFSAEKLEGVVELITILSDEPKMLKQKIKEILGEKCSDDSAEKLSRRKYKDWSRFSKKFLTEIKISVDGGDKSVIDMLWETNQNLMEILSSKYHFNEKIEGYNQLHNPTKDIDSYAYLEDFYCSPAVRRTIWQAKKVLDDIVKAKGKAPAKIFIESTREGENNNKKGKETLSRHRNLVEKYKFISSEDSKAILETLQSTEPQKLQQKKLYLYYMQMGRCAYTGEPIDLDALATSAYDIDHIYPRSKTKDDSLERNLVLVKAEYNRDKTDTYPISEDWRSHMHGMWSFWLSKGLITKEKYERLTRSTELSAEELSGFIARQIVETNQSVKLLRDYLKRKYPDTKIVLTKAGQASDFRSYFAKGSTKSENEFAPKPEFIKIRSLNDLHHAKDAYINIVVGNVLNETFTDDPRYWVASQNGRRYSIKPSAIFRAVPSEHPFVKGWDYQKSIDIISKNMRRNYVLCTCMVYEQSGAITDLMPVGKTTSDESIIPLKKNLPIEKYGGYTKISGAYFVLVELEDKKGTKLRKIIQVPILAKENPEKYLVERLEKKYKNVRIILPRILFGSLLRIDDCLLRLSGRSGESLICAPAVQLFIDDKYNFILKKVVNLNQKILTDKNYVPSEKDGIISGELDELFEHVCERTKIFQKFPSLSNTVDKLLDSKDKFKTLSILDKTKIIENVIKVFGANTSVFDLSLVADKAGNVGKCLPSSTISTFSSVKLVLESPTGIFSREIDLLTVEPK